MHSVPRWKVPAWRREYTLRKLSSRQVFRRFVHKFDELLCDASPDRFADSGPNAETD